jgi:dTDP-4-amino-4,6-dideoxygalactose transaminase
VDFVDIDPVSWNLSTERLREKLKVAKKENRLPKVLVAVHLSGLPCDMEQIHSLSEKYGFHTIEDASHAIGGRYLSEPVGSGRYSDITVFSFHPVKTVTTGEGGMAVTNDKNLADKMLLLRTHGITRDTEQMTHEPDGPWYYQQIDLGFNYRMTDIQAALGLSQLKRLDAFVTRRHELADRYDRLLEELPVECPSRNDEAYSGMHLYVVRIKIDSLRNTHKRVFSYMQDKGVGVNVHYIPVHTQPYFRKLHADGGPFPEAEQYYSEAISLPMYPDLSEQQQTYVVDTLREAISHAGEEG